MAANYFEILIPVSADLQDALIPYLEEIGFNGYLEDDPGLYAYIEESLLEEEKLSDLLNQKFQTSYTKTLIPGKNWNKEWEQNFQPQFIDDQVLIRAPFHNVSSQYPYVITIDPAMAFGTGHHATTANMIRLQLETSFRNTHVFDYGTGSGILAILAELGGSESILASEIQEDALQNAQRNIELNNCHHIKLTADPIESIKDSNPLPFDIILANITRNTIIGSLDCLNQLLKNDGILICSGYLHKEQEMLNEKLKNNGFEFLKALSEGKWGASKFRKAN